MDQTRNSLTIKICPDFANGNESYDFQPLMSFRINLYCMNRFLGQAVICPESRNFLHKDHGQKTYCCLSHRTKINKEVPVNVIADSYNEHPTDFSYEMFIVRLAGDPVVLMVT